MTAGFHARPGARVGLVRARCELPRDTLLRPPLNSGTWCCHLWTGVHVNLRLPRDLGTHELVLDRSQKSKSPISNAASCPGVCEGVPDGPVLSTLRAFDSAARTPGPLNLGPMSCFPFGRFHLDLPGWQRTEALGRAFLSRKATVTLTLGFFSDDV